MGGLRENNLAITKECIISLDILDCFQHFEVKWLFPTQQPMHLGTDQNLVVILVEGETMLSENAASSAAKDRTSLSNLVPNPMLI